ncbi:MAG: transketolase [bacterium]|nr:transketolase [bacterium]
MLFKGKENSIEKKIVDTIRCLGIDIIHEANSGHPGIVLGAAPILYTLYAKHLRFQADDPNWYNRDRFVMSSGHGSALLYATLFLAGFDISLEELKKFRKLDSLTPGHPEYKVTPGVDMTTGPLGQGFASSVGMAIAEEYLRSYYQKKGTSLVNHYTYVLCSDGDLMEGVSYEAASLAGTLKLSHLIAFYDCNHMSLDGDTNLSFTENIVSRFQACHWNVITVNDGEDLVSLDSAIEKAKSSDKPTLIVVKTIIGKYSKWQDSSRVHGTPLEEDDIAHIKEHLEMRNIPFTVSQEVSESFLDMIYRRNDPIYRNWERMKEKLSDEDLEQFDCLVNSFSSVALEDIYYELPANSLEALRDTSGKILNVYVNSHPFLLGGSADLNASTKTYLYQKGDFSSQNRLGQNIWFGVREHAMGAILNGMSLLGLRVFGSTFLSFSDYLRPAIRMSALMKLPVTYIFTHDSISLGEDGPTHQPVEQLVSLRSIPNMIVLRPADANEVIGAYQYLMQKKDGPTALILGRNPVLVKENTSIKEVRKGGYIIHEARKGLMGVIVSSGEEVDTALAVAKKLEERGYHLRVVSMPSIELFEQQEEKYRQNLFPLGIKVFVIEASSSYSWYRYVYNEKYLFTLDEFGASGSKDEVLQRYHFDVGSISRKIETLLK